MGVNEGYRIDRRDRRPYRLKLLVTPMVLYACGETAVDYSQYNYFSCTDNKSILNNLEIASGDVILQ